ncbi:MAG: cupin domain-containing protein [Spirochaetes bacterium]|nr:cupin domain-containing protein [Spirochaetota bacterium]
MRIKQKATFTRDARGLFTCLLSEGLHGYADLNYAETKKGETRGNHYHKTTGELFIVISGAIELTVEKIENDTVVKRETHTFTRFDSFEIEPYENHTIRALEDSTWIALLTETFSEEKMDFHKIPE